MFTGKSASYDIVVGDSQWLGKGADEGHYLEITDFLKQIPNLKEYGKEALAYFCEYPAGSSRYYAAPCETDAPTSRVACVRCPSESTQPLGVPVPCSPPCRRVRQGRATCFTYFAVSTLARSA